MPTDDTIHHAPGIYLAMQYAVSRQLLASTAVASVAPEILRTVGEHLGMEVGAFWRLDAEANVLRCAGFWHSQSFSPAAFEDVNHDVAFSRGEGLPGRVWESDDAVWVADVVRDNNFPRVEAARATGLHAAFAFPLQGAAGLLGVLEFLCRDVRPPDAGLLGAVATLGNQIGQFLERARSEENLRTREAHLRATLDTSLDAIVSMDACGNVSEWNHAAERLFGYSREEALGRDMAELIIPPEYRARHRAGLARYLETEQPRVMGSRLELSALRRDGSEFPVELTITRILVDGPPAFTGYLRDISDRRRIEAEREQLLEAERAARADAEQAGRIKDEFLATLSHELRTPLSAILGWTHLLRSGIMTPDKLERGLEVIERNSHAQTRIIEDLLEMSRIISGKVRLDVQPVDLSVIIAAAVDSAAPAAAAKDIRLQRIVDPLATAVSGDPNRLQQVVWNLLSNALKFTPKAGRVLVVLERVESHIELSVSDTGQGIAPEFLPHVFDRFRQADSSTTRQHGGLGLGLSIVRQLVEMHGGSVRAASPGEGQGTTVTIALPLIPLQTPPPAESRASLRAPAPAAARPDTPSLFGIRILVVDDDADARAVLGNVLKAHGADVLAVGSAGEALSIFAEYRPHVVLSDIGMPGEDGYSLIGKIRALPPGYGADTPAAALTAFARAEDRTKALQHGFQMHLAKPVDPAELLAVVASLARPGPRHS
jgi:PAS domain S-box-containing protein